MFEINYIPLNFTFHKLQNINFVDFFYHLGFCENFDVSLGTDGSPFIFYENLWWPICGQFFSDNARGAELFCEALHYTSGSVSLLEDQTIPMNSFMVGNCTTGDNKLEICSAGCNVADERQNGKKVSPVGKTCRNEKCITNKGTRIVVKCKGKNSENEEGFKSTTESEKDYNDEMLDDEEESLIKPETSCRSKVPNLHI